MLLCSELLFKLLLETTPTTPHTHKCCFPSNSSFKFLSVSLALGTEGEKKGRRREEEARCGLFSVQWFQRMCGAVCGAVNSCPEVWVLTPPRFHMLLSKCMHACLYSTVRLQIQVLGGWSTDPQTRNRNQTKHVHVCPISFGRRKCKHTRKEYLCPHVCHQTYSRAQRAKGQARARQGGKEAA